MKRLLASAATAALLASPLSAFAAPTSGELFARLAAITAPTQTSAEVHGYSEGTYFSAWLNGSQQGVMGAPDAKAKMKMTVDVVQGDMKVRVKAEMRMAERMMYIKVDAVEGDFGNLVSWDVLQKSWLKMSMDDGMMMGAPTPMMLQEILSDASLLSMIDSMFTVTEERYQGGKAYTLKPTDMMLAEMNASAGSTADMTIRVNTTNDGTVSFAAIDVKAEEPSNDMWVTVTGNIQRTNGNVYVEVPKDALNWEEFQSQLGGMFGMESMMSDWPMMGMPDDVEWMNEDNNWGETDDWNSPSSIMPCLDTESEDFWTSDWADEDWIPCEPDAWEDDTDMEWDMWGEPADADMPTWFETCTAEMGTPDYLLQMRKGLCPMTGPAQGSRDERYREHYMQQRY